MLDIIAKIPVKYPFKKHTRKHTHMGTPQRSQIFNCRRNLIKKKKLLNAKNKIQTTFKRLKKVD